MAVPQVGYFRLTFAWEPHSLNKSAMHIQNSQRTFVSIAAISAAMFLASCNKTEPHKSVEDASVEQAKVAQARKDVAEIAEAVKAYYVEYGRYPLEVRNKDAVLEGDDLFNVLATVDAGANSSHKRNPRKIVFLKDPKPKDPWGNNYRIAIDSDYDQKIDPKLVGYKDVDGKALQSGVVVWSYGKDGMQGTNGDLVFTGSDDVASW